MFIEKVFFIVKTFDGYYISKNKHGDDLTAFRNIDDITSRHEIIVFRSEEKAREVVERLFKSSQVNRYAGEWEIKKVVKQIEVSDYLWPDSR